MNRVIKISLFALLALGLSACPTKKSGPIEPKDPARPQPTDPTGPKPTDPDGPVMPAPPTSPSTGLSPGAAPSGEMQAPIVVEVSGPERVAAGDRVEVVVRIRRPSPSALPMEMNVAVPPGANLRDGTAVESIVDSSAETIERRFAVELDRVPAEDLVVTIDQRAPDYGAHATAHYRFGRPEPRLPAPRRAGGDHAMGRPVRLGNH